MKLGSEAVTYDQESDCLYVTLAENPTQVERQEMLDDLRVIDYSGAGAVVGVEFILASEGIDLSDVPFADLVEQLIDQSGQPFRILV